MKQTDYKQINAFAGQYGLIVGLMWVLSFACFIFGLNKPLIGNLALLFGLLSIFVCEKLVRNFRYTVQELRFPAVWRMSLMIYFYASLIMAMAQFIYFRFIDNGLLQEAYSEVLQRPEAITMLQQMMPDEDISTVTEQALAMLGSITPAQMTGEFLIYNLFLGLMLSIPTAVLAKMGRKDPSNNP